MIVITEKTKEAQIYAWTDENDEYKKEFFTFMEKLFNGERSTVRLSLMFCLTVCAFKAEVLWLDECAEALKNCAEGFDSYLLMKQNMHPANRERI